MKKHHLNYIVHIEHNHPFVKHFFRVMASLKNVVWLLSKVPGIEKIPTENEIHAFFVASDVYIYTQEKPSIKLWIGEVPAKVVEHACGKAPRIQEDLFKI